jgi:phosphoribosylamine--glycine ligase
MGAVSPVPFADAAFLQKVENKIVKPTIAGLKKDKLPYKGFVFIGLMNVKGEPFVIEYNVRMGDPETEVVMPRIQSDLLDLLVAVADGKLHDFTLDISTDTAVTVMLVSGGYPGDFEKGKSIAGLDEVEGVLVFHAGTTVHNNTVKTAGGRVMAVTARGKSIEQCREKIYTEINKICYDGIYYRKDIGLDLLKN